MTLLRDPRPPAAERAFGHRKRASVHFPALENYVGIGVFRPMARHAFHPYDFLSVYPLRLQPESFLFRSSNSIPGKYDRNIFLVKCWSFLRVV